MKKKICLLNLLTAFDIVSLWFDLRYDSSTFTVLYWFDFEPMDLGTIKSKLEKNVYSGVEEFAADIRLTFSNARQSDKIIERKKNREIFLKRNQ